MPKKAPMSVKNRDFIYRFIEVCGSSKVSDIARLLDVSYQAARNYLDGRMPDTHILRIIAESTPYSIHWLLTGEGNKFVEVGGTDEEITELLGKEDMKTAEKNFDDPADDEDTHILSDEARRFIREVCSEIIRNMPDEAEVANQTKEVVLDSANVRKEKALDEPSSDEEHS